MKIDDTIREYFRRGMTLFYDTRETKTMKETFERTLTHFFHQGMDLQNGVLIPILPPAEELPTLAQFQHWYRQERNPKDLMMAQESKPISQIRKRGWPGRLLGPGSVCNIVAAVADMYLVSALNRQRIIGRPVMYLVIDMFSNLIAGMSVSLEGPSGLGAMLALKNMAQDKVAFCKEYGFDITEYQWPSHHLPQEIHAEQEELFSNDVGYLTNVLNIQLTNAASYQLDWKRYFERNFQTFSAGSIHWQPDSVYPPHELGRKGSRLDGRLTFHDFLRLLINCILEHNTSYRVNDDYFDQQMIQDGVEPYPCDVWKWGIQNRSGTLRNKPIDVIRLHLLTKAHALVTQHGLRFRSLHYTCDRAIQEQWFEQVRSGIRSWRISIVYDPQTADYIYLCDESGKYAEVCSLVDKDKMSFANCSWFDVENYFVEHGQCK